MLMRVSKPTFAAGAFAVMGVATACSDPGARTPPVEVQPEGSAAAETAHFCPDVAVCVSGKHWERAACSCVVDVEAGAPTTPTTPTKQRCPQFMMCMAGLHFDDDACTCVADGECATADDAGAPPPASGDAGTHACVQFMMCVRATHFDHSACTCIPDET